MGMSLNEYRIIVETAPNLIWRSGLDAKCYYFNKTWLDFTDNVVVRVNSKFSLEYHIDIDEANCAGIKQGDKAYLMNFTTMPSRICVKVKSRTNLLPKTLYGAHGRRKRH